ncbi:phosphate-starvation-inducible PsiE family protein [Nitrospira lenta]|uniref:Phosphate-starvation-inducible E n=1 Tax=Nitrospira lenta TaxID=1436998 RepID=A0A330L569_9BACT|nr:phosphate-starvation-inducible PsiE family protein [Nitrospira lenta]SPP64436.1 conserved membrane hypothetical protein [Nitrospira lenta]
MGTDEPRAHRNELMRRWCQYMEWLDRLGYATAGFSLLILGMLVFIHAWYVFLAGQFDPKGQVLILPAGLRLLNDILLVIILLELFRTVVRFLQTEVMELEPYLSVGVIACTRKILTASAELSHQQHMTDTQFYQYLMDVGLNVTVIMALIGAIIMIRKRPEQKPLPVTASAPASR